MKITYDKVADAFTLIFNDKGRVSEDKQITENIFAGFDRTHNIVEIQILDVSKMHKPWISLAAAAKYLNKSERTLLRWIKARKIIPIKVGKEYRIKPEELEKLAS